MSGLLSAVPSELRAVLVKRCPQMADGVIEDEDARSVTSYGPGPRARRPMDASRRTRRAARY